MSCRCTQQELDKERRTAALLLCPVYLGCGSAQPLVLATSKEGQQTALRLVNVVATNYKIPRRSLTLSLQEVAVKTLKLLTGDGRNEDFLGKTCTGDNLPMLQAKQCVLPVCVYVPSNCG